jgi:hypothetical protein
VEPERKMKIHPDEWTAYIRWRIEKALKRIRQFVA